MNTGFDGISWKQGLRLVVLATAVAGLAPLALAHSFPPPQLDGFEKQSERDADGDGDGVKETRIDKYVNQAGDSIVAMTTRGRLWAWSLDTAGDESGTHNYVIRDSDCDGIFDEVYGLDEEFHVPDCLR
jgi:hypothetical protein